MISGPRFLIVFLKLMFFNLCGNGHSSWIPLYFIDICLSILLVTNFQRFTFWKILLFDVFLVQIFQHMYSLDQQVGCICLCQQMSNFLLLYLKVVTCLDVNEPVSPTKASLCTSSCYKKVYFKSFHQCLSLLTWSGRSSSDEESHPKSNLTEKYNYDQVLSTKSGNFGTLHIGSLLSFMGLESKSKKCKALKVSTLESLRALKLTIFGRNFHWRILITRKCQFEEN